MLKRFRQIWKSFIRHHIACWPEEFNPQSPQSPLPDSFNLLRSVQRFYKLNPTGFDYMIHFDPLYDHAVNLLSEEGWPVRIDIHPGGKACYRIGRKENL